MIYMVMEQWPRREVATFNTLKEAQDYMKDKSSELNLPIIVILNSDVKS